MPGMLTSVRNRKKRSILPKITKNLEVYFHFGALQLLYEKRHLTRHPLHNRSKLSSIQTHIDPFCYSHLPMHKNKHTDIYQSQQQQQENNHYQPQHLAALLIMKTTADVLKLPVVIEIERLTILITDCDPLLVNSTQGVTYSSSPDKSVNANTP